MLCCPLKIVMGISKKKWVSTGYEVKGNKRKALDKLNELLQNEDFSNDTPNTAIKENKPQNPPEEELFLVDFLIKWLNDAEGSVEEITYLNYKKHIKHFVKYFIPMNVKLKDFSPRDLQSFYNMLYARGTSTNTTIHYHTTIRKALQYALNMELVNRNIADVLGRPKKTKYQAKFYNKDELEKMFEAIKGDPLELVITITTYYGLRRSEVLGLKWQAIDFKNKLVHINHKIINCNSTLIAKDKMKNKTSNRTLPLIPHIEKLLLEAQKEQKENHQLFGNSYNKDYLDYVCVDKMGKLFHPDYLTNHFRELQKQHNLKHIRFHDLRHSCASLMVANGVPMKQIQEWLGHSSYNVTADLYVHLDYSSKINSANSISSALDFNTQPQQTNIKDFEDELERKKREYFELLEQEHKLFLEQQKQKNNEEEME